MKARLLLSFCMVGIGIIALIINGFSYLDDPPPSFQASDFVEIRRESLVEAQPKPHDWPLIVARQFLVDGPRPPETYVLRVGKEREACLIRVHVGGESRQRTTALASWLAASLERSLQQSLPASAALLDPVSARRLNEAEQYSLPIGGRWFPVTAELLASVLLVIGGVVIFRSRKHHDR